MICFIRKDKHNLVALNCGYNFIIFVFLHWHLLNLFPICIVTAITRVFAVLPWISSCSSKIFQRRFIPPASSSSKHWDLGLLQRGVSLQDGHLDFKEQERWELSFQKMLIPLLYPLPDNRQVDTIFWKVFCIFSRTVVF